MTRTEGKFQYGPYPLEVTARVSEAMRSCMRSQSSNEILINYESDVLSGK